MVESNQIKLKDTGSKIWDAIKTDEMPSFTVFDCQIRSYCWSHQNKYCIVIIRMQACSSSISLYCRHMEPF